MKSMVRAGSLALAAISRVSPRVNGWKADDPELITPLAPAAQPELLGG